MFTSMKLREIYSLLWVIAIILVIHALSDCRAHDLAKTGQAPTQDVGEQPPSRLPSPTPLPPTPTSTSTWVIPTEPATMLVGPTPYPPPGPEIAPWEQLLNPSLIADVNWETYRGKLQGNDKSDRWSFTFLYPAGWYADTKSSPIQAFVQNVPVTQSPAPAEFVKFEIVRLSDPPMIEDGHALYPKDLITVKMAGEPGILYSVTQQADQMRQIMVIFQHNGGWLVATGYITLSAPDPAALERFSAIIFNLLASFSLGEQPFQVFTFQDGPFDFTFYLYQNPDFSQNPSMTWLYSDLPGVGSHVSWVYHGSGLKGPVSEYWGRCPEINPLDTLPDLKEGDSSVREGGILLPQNVQPGSVHQYVFKVETTQGTYGGVLSFLLIQGDQGFEPSNVTIYPLSQAGNTYGCISELLSSNKP